MYGFILAGACGCRRGFASDASGTGLGVVRFVEGVISAQTFLSLRPSEQDESAVGASELAAV